MDVDVELFAQTVFHNLLACEEISFFEDAPFMVPVAHKPLYL